MEVAALAVSIVSLIGVIGLMVVSVKRGKEIDVNESLIKSVSDRLKKLIQEEEEEYFKIFKKIIFKDNYLAERITNLESEMKRNFKEDTERWLDELDDDHVLYTKIMNEVTARIEKEVAAGHNANETLYKRIMFKLKHRKAPFN